MAKIIKFPQNRTRKAYKEELPENEYFKPSFLDSFIQLFPFILFLILISFLLFQVNKL